jgi:hypothetical protein
MRLGCATSWSSRAIATSDIDSFVPQASRIAYANPNGVSSHSPGLAAIGGLPRVGSETSGLYPNGVASIAAMS